MSYQSVFRRYEIKYLISREQRSEIMTELEKHMNADRYGRSSVRSLYFDTPDYRLVRRSLEKPVYKEKLRLRSYGRATAESSVFVELKKKYKSVVYKRRIAMSERDAVRYLQGGEKVADTQITREIDYFLRFYAGLRPSVFLSYDREAFYGKEDGDFRVTFDENILWRKESLSLETDAYGERLLSPGVSLMEIKTATAIPLWLTSVLSANRIYRTSFSKYGRAYLSVLDERQSAPYAGETGREVAAAEAGFPTSELYTGGLYLC